MCQKYKENTLNCLLQIPASGQNQQMPTTSSVWHPNTEVVANYNFPGRSGEDLPFQRGDVLVIIKNTSVSNHSQDF